ncbi:MAG: hypothetical protein RMY28_009550 [Nostoc sp. ChiSLP01]|nr:hypothetical protein [Nostoc sp. CmiSLP01]MDZ8285200.1 hypothetical protein [Nostoc sp. ChiSLP01]
MLKYTTSEAIARRLKNRLELKDGPPTLGQTQSLGAKQVDYSLYEQLGEQAEAKLNMALSMLYELPVPNDATEALKILASIVEKFVVAEILSVHYQQTQGEGGDQGYGSVLFKQAKEECQAIGITLPGITPQASTPFNRVEALVLPRVPKKGEIPDVVSRSYSLVEQRNPTAASSIDWGI